MALSGPSAPTATNGVYLQRSKFGANAQPFHVIVDNDAKPLAPAFVYKEDIPAYKNFLNLSIDRYKKGN